MALRLSPSCFLHGCGPKSSTVMLLPPFPSSYKPGHFAMLAGIDKKKKKKKKNVVRAISPEKLEVVKSMEGWMEDNVLTFLKPVESSWQPQDFLPDPSGEGFLDGIKEIRERAAEIPDAYYVCLVGNMITEEALPTYENVLNTFDGTRDETGASMTAWARWTRKWTSEENRHGDVLNKYLYLSGRLNMRQIEKTIQYLIGSGMMIEADNDPYRGFVYTSFQERATFISHGNTARKAKEHGDMLLAKICGLIAADEKRHEMAYTKIVEKLFEVDPEATMLALADMMRKRIKMPARFMFDGQERDIFRHYSSVAQRLGVYTSKDYGDVVEFFVERWKVGEVTGLSGEGRRAQDYVCSLPSRLRKTEERAQERAEKKTSMVPFSWIFNREVEI